MAILTRQTSATGVTNKQAPLTNSELDNNFIELVQGKLSPNIGNTPITNLKTVSFYQQTAITATTGSITVDWTTAQNQKQTEPTGTITYTFTAPTGPCHLQLIIDSDGTSTPQIINWPASVIWVGSTWSADTNKKAVINFWYDGTNYYAIGANQV